VVPWSVGADTGVGACDGALMTGDCVVSLDRRCGVVGKPPCATGKLVGSATGWRGLSGLNTGALTGPSPGDITGAEGESIALVNCIRCYPDGEGGGVQCTIEESTDRNALCGSDADSIFLSRWYYLVRFLREHVVPCILFVPVPSSKMSYVRLGFGARSNAKPRRSSLLLNNSKENIPCTVLQY
jgi:hypothetical protein